MLKTPLAGSSLTFIYNVDSSQLSLDLLALTDLPVSNLSVRGKELSQQSSAGRHLFPSNANPLGELDFIYLNSNWLSQIGRHSRSSFNNEINNPVSLAEVETVALL